MIRILYTTSDSIRATIGVDENDLSDDMLAAQNLDLAMLERLDTILPTFEAIHDGSDAGERRMTLWCQYFGALHLLENATLGFLQHLQANNDKVARFAVDFEVLKDSLRKKLAQMEYKMGAASTKVTLLSRAIPDFNPVTG